MSTEQKHPAVEVVQELTQPANNVVLKPSVVLGDSLSGLIKLICMPLLKQNILKDAQLEDFKNKIEKKAPPIDSENLTEPPLNIVGPALEASKYYIGDEVLRETFANLIASACDKTKVNSVHPSFVEIIKQMSPLDAQVLSGFKAYTNKPIVEIRVGVKHSGYVSLHTNIINPLVSVEDVFLESTSISSLERLGILVVDYNKSLLDHQYDIFNELELYRQLKKQYSSMNRDLSIQPGVAELTPIGAQFIRICL